MTESACMIRWRNVGCALALLILTQALPPNVDGCPSGGDLVLSGSHTGQYQITEAYFSYWVDLHWKEDWTNKVWKSPCMDVWAPYHDCWAKCTACDQYYLLDYDPPPSDVWYYDAAAGRPDCPLVSPAAPTDPGGEEAKSIDPINTINGNVTVRETDIVIPCPGMPLLFSRAYNSRASSERTLGKCWTHSYDWYLSETNKTYEELGETKTNTWKVLHTGDGQVYSFLDNEDGSYLSPPEDNWTLTTNDNYELTLPFGLLYTFDSTGTLTCISDTFTNTITLSYASDLLTQILHSNGRELDLTYTNSRLSNVTTPSSNLWIDLSYDSESNLLSVVRQGSQAPQTTVTYASDSTGNLLYRTNALGHCYSWLYATNSNMGTNVVLESDYYKTFVDYSHSNDNYTVLDYDRNGTSQSYEYHYDETLGRITAIYGPGDTNFAVTYDLDTSGNTTNEIVADCSVGQWISTLRSFDDYHQVTNQSFGYCTSTWEYAWAYTWDSTYRGCPTSITDPEGNEVEYEYTNALLKTLKLIVSTNESYDTSFTYTTNGLPSTVVNPNGVQVSYAYDTEGYLSSMTSAVGQVVLFYNDEFGRVTNTVYVDEGIDERSVYFERDELGHVLSATYISSTNDGATQLSEAFAYDAIGNLTNHVDTGGRTTAYTYAPAGHLSSVIRQLGETCVTNSFEYDNLFNVLSITDAEDRAVETYVLDLQNRPVTINNLEGQTMSVTYAVADYVAAVQRFDGTIVTNQYDAGGRLASVTYLDGVDVLDTLSFSHHKNGLLASAENDTGLITNVYNSVNRLSSTTSPVPNGAVAYTYHSAGQVASVTCAAGETTYTLDSADRVDQIDSPAGSFDLSFHTNGCNMGLLYQVACSNGLTASYWRDAFGRIQSIAWHDSDTNTLKSFHYEYNTAGMITNIDYESGEFVTFTYDDLDRLTGETHYTAAEQEIWDQTYAYDNVGNRLQKTSDDLTIAYTLEAGNNRLSGWTMATNLSGYVDVVGYADENVGTNWRFGELWISNSVAVTPSTDGSNFWYYDLPTPLGTQDIVCAIRDMAGNMTYVTNQFLLTAVTNAAYAYDLAGCTTNISYAGVEYSANVDLSWDARYQLESVSLDGTEIEAYQYDALGRRTCVSNETAVTYFVHDGAHVAAEVDAVGTVTRSYTHGPGIDNVLAMTVHGDGGTNTNYYFITDHLGTVHAVTDESGNIVEEYRFDAWGRVLGIYDGDGAPLAESAIGNRFLFQGREYSWKIHAATGGSGLYHFRARTYDPVTGRWLSKDPIGIGGGLNQYAFCANNPVNYRDPFGLCIEDEYRRRLEDIDATERMFGPVRRWLMGPYFDALRSGVITEYEARRAGFSPDAARRLGITQGTSAIISQEASVTAVAVGAAQAVGSAAGNAAPVGGWERRGPNYYNPSTGESLHPHPGDTGHGPHIDYHQRGPGPDFRINPDGTIVPKP